VRIQICALHGEVAVCEDSAHKSVLVLVMKVNLCG
jgi:hypothetical protein